MYHKNMYPKKICDDAHGHDIDKIYIVLMVHGTKSIYERIVIGEIN